MKANQSDEVLDVVAELADRRMDPIPLRGSSLFLRYKREAVLVKGQSKTSDLLFHIPDMPAELDENGLPAKPTMRMMYNQRGLGAPLADNPSASNLARPEQYSVVVLAKDANRQSFWSGLNCMTWPSTALIDDSKKTSPHRPVIVAEKDASKSLPSNALMWTSISHLIWYDADPSVISEEQQQAILDWIHSGGQLIISGPDGLSAVNQSFLSSSLPATQLETSSLDTALAERFASAWRIAKAGDDTLFRLPAMRAIPLLQGELKEGAQ